MFKGHAKTATSANYYEKISTITVDALVKKHEFHPNLIKIDVEGAESLVLYVTLKTVEKHKPWIMVEMHSPPELPMLENALRVLSWCKTTGYRAWYMKEGVELKNARQISHRGKCHLLLMPLNMDYPSDLTKIPQRTLLPYG